VVRSRGAAKFVRMRCTLHTTATMSVAVASEEVFRYSFPPLDVSVRIREKAPVRTSLDDPKQKAFREKSSHDVTGWTIWGSSVILARWILDNKADLAGKSVLELGSGCALPGIVAATQTAATSCMLTDGHALTLENMRYNIGLNCDVDGAADGDCWRSATGCRVSSCALDWDDEATWPPAAAAVASDATGDGSSAASTVAAASADASDAPPPAYERYDVILVSDATYKRSYARKLFSVVDSLLLPGGLFVYASPAARDGLPTLLQLLAGRGYAVTETPAPPAWRASPLQPLTTGGVVDGSVAASDPAAAASAGSGSGAAAAGASASSDDDEKRYRALFPELAMPHYELLVVTARKAA